MHAESRVLELELDRHVATVWLNRPDKLNAMGQEFWDDLPTLITSLGTDDQVRVIVIQGRGRSFTVGIDLAMFAGFAADAGATASAYTNNFEFYEKLKMLQNTMTSLADVPKPIIAAVHGHCLGGGIDLITAADIRLASDDAIFSVRETKLGMVADVGTTQRLPSVLAPGHAAELLYTGKDIDAGRALAIGLVNDIYPDVETLHKAAHELALEIASNSPVAVQGIKRVLLGQEGRTVDEALDYMALWSTAFLQSDDLTEGVTAQVERRSPDFKGS